MDEQKSDVEPLPELVTDYIDRVIKKMRYRRRVREEVRRELGGHFVDALAECETDSERNDLAQKLIEEFGDEKLLAKLIRRGKKRCRPLWKKAIIAGFRAMGIFIVLLGLYTWWFYSGKPTITVDYIALMNQKNRPDIAEKQNAWPDYEKAIAHYVEPDDQLEETFRVIQDRQDRKIQFCYLSQDLQNDITKWVENNKDTWLALNSDQQTQILQCINEGVIPIFVHRNRSRAPIYSDMDWEIEKSVKSIQNKRSPHLLTTSRRPGRKKIDYLALPYKELDRWGQEESVPKAINTAIKVAVTL